MARHKIVGKIYRVLSIGGMLMISLCSQASSPSDTVIAFDLHKVLLEQNFARIGFKLFKRYWQPLIKDKLLFTPHFIRDIYGEMRQGQVIEELAHKLGKKYTLLSSLEADLIECLNSEPLIDATVHIVQELKAQGYSLYLLSNIASETFENLRHKQPALISLFEGFYMPSAKNKYIHKPNPHFYQNFKQYLTSCGQEHKKIVFIDDRLKNIKAAQLEGMHGIVFNSPAQLRHELHAYGLLPAHAKT